MANHVWSVLCTKASTDSESNNISLFDVVESISFGPSNVPPEGESIAFAIELQLVSLWTRSDPEREEAVSVRSLFVHPDETEMGRLEQEVNLANTLRGRTIAKLTSLIMRGPGIYVFRVQRRDTGAGDWDTVAEIPLEIRFLEQSAAIPETGS